MCQKLGATLGEEGIYALYDKVIQPSGYQTELINLYHSIAHQVVQKTYAMLQQTWFWPEMLNTVMDRLSRCIYCLQTKPQFGKGKIPIEHSPHL